MPFGEHVGAIVQSSLAKQNIGILWIFWRENFQTRLSVNNLLGLDNGEI
jgi:hypothetical protein